MGGGGLRPPWGILASPRGVPCLRLPLGDPSDRLGKVFFPQALLDGFSVSPRRAQRVSHYGKSPADPKRPPGRPRIGSENVAGTIFKVNGHFFEN